MMLRNFHSVFRNTCVENFAECSAIAGQKDRLDLSHNTVMWNNKFIFIYGNSVYKKRLIEKGIIGVGDLLTKENQLINTGNLIELEFSSINAFELMALIYAIFSQWRQSLKITSYVEKETFVLQN